MPTEKQTGASSSTVRPLPPRCQAHPGRDVLDEPHWVKLVAHFDLTPRELDVTKALVDYDHYPYVAQSLGLSIDTVRCHIKHIYSKFGVDNRGDLIAACIYWACRECERDSRWHENAQSERSGSVNTSFSVRGQKASYADRANSAWESATRTG